jgi:hypothetical protein
MFLIVLRKKNLVKRRTGCCAKRGQRQNALALDVHPGSPFLLAISGFGEVRKKSTYMQPLVAYFAGSVCKRRSTEY